MKLDFRSRTTYTLTQVTEPITLDSEDFRNAKPPFEGETEEDFWEYIKDNLSDWEAEQYIEDNEGVLSEDLLNELYSTFVEYPTKEMFDSRTKSDDYYGKRLIKITESTGFNLKYNNGWNGNIINTQIQIESDN